MKGLVETVASPRFNGVLIEAFTKGVAMFLPPWGVVDLCNDGLHMAVPLIVAEVETHGIEAVAEVPEVGQEADGSRGSCSCSFLDQVPHCSAQWDPGIAQMIPPSEVGQIDAFGRPKPAFLKQPWEFGQVQVHHEQPISETVFNGAEAAMTHPAFVDAAVHDQRPFPKCSHTESALFTPSS